MEKDIIRERVVAGLANARGKGKRLGRPPFPDGLLEKAKALRAEGLSFRNIGKRLGVDEGTVRKKMKATRLHTGYTASKMNGLGKRQK